MSDSQIEEIKSRIDILDLLSEYIPIKKAGTNHKALCPFHNEKTPSFIVSPEKQIWHCFGCGEGGDIFKFIMKIENAEFPEALTLLAERAGVKLRRVDPKLKNQKTRILELLKMATSYYQKQLIENQEAKKARIYLKKERGLNDQTIGDFLLGYSLDNWESGIKHFEENGFSQDEIFLAGLSIKKEGGRGFYDRFRGRIMFPITDIHSNIIGYSARTLSEDDKMGKYINTPQTLVYNKSKVLYGLSQAKKEIKEKGFGLVVEGNMDVLACFQAGIRNVVASSGTALTEDQLLLMKRYSKEIAFSFDTDRAGVEAMKRGVEIALGSGLEIKIVKLPVDKDGSSLYKDPDECLKKDPTVFLEAIDKRKPVMEHLFKEILEGVDLNNVSDKKLAVKELMGFISKIPDTVEMTHYLQKLSEIINVEEKLLREALPSKRTYKKDDVKIEAGPVENIDRSRNLAEHFFCLLIFYPSNLDYAIANLLPEMIGDMQITNLYKDLIIHYTEGKLNIENIGENLKKIYNQDKKTSDYLDVLGLLFEDKFNDFTEIEVSEEIVKLIQEIKRSHLLKSLKDIEKDLIAAENSKDKEKIMDLTQRFKELTDELNSIN